MPPRTVPGSLPQSGFLESSRSEHGFCSLLDRCSHWVQVQAGVDRGRLVALVVQALADDRKRRSRDSLPASHGAAKVMDPEIRNSHALDLQAEAYSSGSGPFDKSIQGFVNFLAVFLVR